MKATDEQLIESFKRTLSPRATGRELGMHANNVSMRLLRLRLKGVDLPEALKGFALNRESAREAGRKGGRHVKGSRTIPGKPRI